MNKKSKIVIFVILVIMVCVLFFDISLAQERKGVTVGERFHKETSLHWLSALSGVFGAKPKKPSQYKTYPDAKKIALPKPGYQGLTVEQAIMQRRSVRNYSKEPITLQQLSELLFAAQGVTDKMFGRPLRSAPSAGALYPIEVYAVVNNVTGPEQGIYHFSVRDHSLELVKAGDFSRKITRAGLEQEMLGDSAVTFVLSAVFDRTRYKYGERGFRYVYMEAGHISQNIYLEAVSLGLGSVCAGAFIDEQVNELIGVDGIEEAAIYLHAAGNL